MRRLRITVEGRGTGASLGAEINVLAWSDGVGTPRFSIDQLDADWTEIANILVTDGKYAPTGAKADAGTNVWIFSDRFALYVLAHPWSGVVIVSCDGRDVEFDLYNPTPQVRVIEAPDLSMRALTAPELDELLFALKSSSVERAVWRLTPFGAVVIDELSGPQGERLDPLALLLTPPPPAFSADVAAITLAASGGWALNAEAEVEAPEEAVFALRSGPQAGDCVIETAGVRELISLHAATPGRRLVTAPSPARRARRHFLLFDEDRSQYAELLARIDPAQPVALHVPRWKGVASSTLNLFQQRLPIPVTSETPPETTTEKDVQRYARMLLSTGAAHFVISGGDLFYIRLMRAVRALAPAVRFDLLWHSNYVQMGESHDWALLRQWLAAHAEGLVHRIGVVKEGLDEFFRAHGVDSVFIKNVVEVDPEAIRPSVHDGSVGIWLSGSSDYRKLPYAALLALAQLDRYPLKASGLNQVARQLATSLNLPVRRIWPNPIPRAQLYREMAATAATLYVTLSECSPMLPLESFALGVPCLVGPSSHLFRTDPYLGPRLIVEDPLNPSLIARMLEDLVAERDAVINAYRSYAVRELAEARAGVAMLLQ
jgi:hypothetical protein